MTALAYALPLNTAAEPDLDYFDHEAAHAPRRPELRVINGSGDSLQAVTPVGGARPAQAAQPNPSVELYRRRRFLVLVIVTGLVLAIAWASGISLFSLAASGSAADPVDAVLPAVHVVLPGDSYAAIAAGLGAVDPIDAGEQLRADNGGSELVVGQRLVIDLAAIAGAA